MSLLISELRRRQVFRALAAYAAVCWLLIEIASVVVPVMEWPQQIIRLFIYAVVAGLPLCILAAWFFDLTPSGFRREVPPSEHSAAPVHGGGSRAFYGFVAGVLVSSLTLALYSDYRSDSVSGSLAEVELLARDGHFLEAFQTMEALPESMRQGEQAESLWPMISDRLSLVTVPEGAAIRGRYLPTSDQEPAEIDLGTTPLDRIRVARHDLLLTISADGFVDRELLVSGRFDRQEGFVGDQALLDFQLVLQPMPVDGQSRSLPVPGGRYTLISADLPGGQEVDLDDFLIQRYEVSNADFLAFIQADGYRVDAHWDSAARLGSTLRAQMTDRTGMPAPRAWSGQEPPPNQDDHPVVGVTWFEADAYCRWAGLSLPSAFQWEKASRDGRLTRLGGFAMPWGLATVGESLVNRANYSSNGLLPVDSLPFGQSPYGLYNTAGNAKEWLYSQSRQGRLVSGGSWRDPAYLYSEFGALDPAASGHDLGFRCASWDDVGGIRPLQVNVESPQYEPVSRERFDGFLDHFRYDPGEGEVRAIGQVTAADWTRYEIAFPGPSGEWVTGFFWMPRNGSAPYQTLVAIPHGGAFYGVTNIEIVEKRFAPLIRDGRAVFSVVMKGMAGREWGEGHSPPATDSVRFRDELVLHATELRLGLDYLSRRGDVAMDRLAYVAISWGAGSRLAFAAVDDRYGAVVLIGAGIDERVKPTLPEVDNVNFAPYIEAPVLVINGLLDEEHPWESRGLPLWNLLSEPRELVLLEGVGHVPGPGDLIPAMKTFLDRQFGPP